MAKKTSPAKRTMSSDQRAAMSRGRIEASAVRKYLDALQASQSRSGKKDASSITAQIEQVDKQMVDADALKVLKLRQRRRDLNKQLAALETQVRPEDLEQGFLEHANAYAERNGIEYSTWREAGVPARVLRSAGISKRHPVIV